MAPPQFDLRPCADEVRVTIGDVTGDGVEDVITATGRGGGPNVKMFDGATGHEVRSFLAYDPGFRGGLVMAAGDFDEDGVTDLITGAGAGGGTHVQVFSGKDGAVLQSLFAYAPEFAAGCG